jgi:hypothetical protein
MGLGVGNRRHVGTPAGIAHALYVVDLRIDVSANQVALHISVWIKTSASGSN